MKRLFSVLLIALLGGSFVFADEDDSMFKPGFSINNETSFTTEKQGEDNNNGNFVKGDIENSTDAKFSVGISIGENFSLKPYISDKVVVSDKDIPASVAAFRKNDFILGLGAKYKPIDLLSLSFGLGYISRYEAFGLSDLAIAGLGGFVGNGLKANIGLGAEIESIFLTFDLGYNFNAMWQKARYGSESNKVAVNSDIRNVITLETTFDFFNFIKEGLNSGLILSNETKFKSKSMKSKEFSDKWTGSFKIENEFAFGLHFAPVEFMDAKFLTKIGSSSEKAKALTGDSYSDPKKETTVALALGLDFSKDMFSFGVEYTPTLMKKVGDADPDKNLEHEFKFAVGIEL